MVTGSYGRRSPTFLRCPQNARWPLDLTHFPLPFRTFEQETPKQPFDKSGRSSLQRTGRPEKIVRLGGRPLSSTILGLISHRLSDSQTSFAAISAPSCRAHACHVNVSNSTMSDRNGYAMLRCMRVQHTKATGSSKAKYTRWRIAYSSPHVYLLPIQSTRYHMRTKLWYLQGVAVLLQNAGDQTRAPQPAQ